MSVNYFVLSEKGTKNKINEDNYSPPFIDVDFNDDKIDEKGHLFIVSDGMGGHKAGEVASKMAAKITGSVYYKNEKQSITLQAIIQAVNSEIYLRSQEKEDYRGMGATIVALLIKDNTVNVCNVGDSRAYLFSEDNLKQLTKDHSLVWEKYEKGDISKDDIIQDPEKNIISRAVGLHKKVEVDTFDYELPHKFIYLLCSDGLTDFLTDSSIKEIIHNGTSIESLAHKLKDAAIDAGSNDDITILLVSNHIR